MLNSIKYDPVENTEEYKAVVEEVDKKARKRVEAIVQKLVNECDSDIMKNFIKRAPTSHRFAYEKKRILKDEYGIEWKSYIEMNPENIFD